VHVIQIFPGGQFSSLIQALDYCIEHEIDVANLSLGGGQPSRIVEERLVRAKEMGVACIVAAGNSGGPVQFPASLPHVLSVSAIGKKDEFPPDSFHATQVLEGHDQNDFFAAKFSCFGPEVDVCAPGVAIVSSVPADGFSPWDGTSMATPHVTGMAALILAHHTDFKTNFSTRDAKRVERLFQIIKETAMPLDLGDPNRTGAGLPNVARALGLESQTTVQNIPLGELPVSAEQARVLAQLLQSLLSAQARVESQSLGNAIRVREPKQGTASTAPASAGATFAPAAVDEWRNPPTAHGPAMINSGAGLSSMSADSGDGGVNFDRLRSAMLNAGLMH
jgi:hypothetical protein